MNYYEQLADSVGLKSRTIRTLVEEVFAEPTDRRWYVLAIILISVRPGLKDGCPAAAVCDDLLTIVKLEREAMRKGGT